MRSFMVCKQRGEMGGERGIVREDKWTNFWWGNLKESKHLEDLAVDGSIIVQVIKHKQGLARLCHFGVVTVRCTKHFVQWNLQFVGSQFGICFVSPLWRLKF
jgi:hypothetical protein